MKFHSKSGSVLVLGLLTLGVAWSAYSRVAAREPRVSAGAEQPQAAVLRYFDAVSRSDCRALNASVTGVLAREHARAGCAATLNRMRSHAVKYLSCGVAKVDGRDPHAFLLPIRLQFGGKEKTAIVRVVQHEGTFKVATL